MLRICAAELINPVLLKGPIIATDDNLVDAVNGIFSLNQPSAAHTGPNDHGLLMSFKINETNSCILIMFSIRGKIYSRFKSSSGVWSNWSVFTGVNYIP